MRLRKKSIRYSFLTIFITAMTLSFWSTGYYHYYHVEQNPIKQKYDQLQNVRLDHLAFVDGYSLDLTYDVLTSLDMASGILLFQFGIRVAFQQQISEMKFNSTNFEIEIPVISNVQINGLEVPFKLTNKSTTIGPSLPDTEPNFVINAEDTVRPSKYYNNQVFCRFQVFITKKDDGATLTLPVHTFSTQLIGLNSSVTLKIRNISLLTMVSMFLLVFLTHYKNIKKEKKSGHRDLNTGPAGYDG